LQKSLITFSAFAPQEPLTPESRPSIATNTKFVPRAPQNLIINATPVCAIASMISTPGMIGLPENAPEMRLIDGHILDSTMRFTRSISSIASTIRNG
jgi:hypothetical protein